MNSSSLEVYLDTQLVLNKAGKSINQLAFESYDHSKNKASNDLKFDNSNDFLEPQNDRIDEEDDY